MNNPLYTTDKSEDGRLLIGGIWRMFHQDGFPIEMSHLHLQSLGHSIDWMEAMADASTDNNLPALVDHMRSFMDEQEVQEIGFRFMVMLKNGYTYQSILDNKRKDAPPLPSTAIST